MHSAGSFIILSKLLNGEVVIDYCVLGGRNQTHRRHVAALIDFFSPGNSNLPDNLVPMWA